MFAALSLIQKIVGIAALSIILALSIALFFADRRADKWEAKAIKCGATLERLAEESKRDQAEVKERIVGGRERRVYIDRAAKPVENAPLEGQCRTPAAVMESGL